MAEDKIGEEALAWLIRVNEAGFRDWEGFEDWIGRDPAHATRYWRMARAEAEAAAAEVRAQPMLSVVPPSRPASVRPLFRWAAFGTGLAAIAASLLLLIPGHGHSLEYEAQPGVPRSIVLASGDRIDLNGGARIVVEQGSGRHVRLDRGEALFTVAHNAAHPFTVDLGETKIRDVGTVFDVARGGDGAIDLAVSEGAVLFDPDGVARTLTRGDALRMEAGTNTVRIAKVDPEAVGSWHAGRLRYDGAPLSDVAADIGRATGQPVALAPSIAARRFTGTLMIGDRQTLVTRAAALLGLEVQRQRLGWQLAEPPAAHR